MQNRRYRTGDTDRIKRKSLGLSFLIHSVGIFVLFTSPWNRQAVTTHEVFSVQIIDVPVEVLKQITPEEKFETPPKVTRTTKPAVKAKTPVEKSAASPVQRAFSFSTVEKSAASPVPRAFSFSAEKFREKLSSKIERSSTEKTPRKIEEIPPVKIKKIENTATDVNVSTLNLTIPQWYISLVQSSIKKNWEIYNMLGSRATTVSFRIFRNGRIDNIALEKSSGNSNFDRSVIDAVKKTKNLPPFPQEISERYLDIVIDFETEG